MLVELVPKIGPVCCNKVFCLFGFDIVPFLKYSQPFRFLRVFSCETQQRVQRLQRRGGPGRRTVRCRAGILLREEPVTEHFHRISSRGGTPFPGLAPVPYGRQGRHQRQISTAKVISLRHGYLAFRETISRSVVQHVRCRYCF